MHQSHTTSNPPSLSCYRYAPSKRTRSSTSDIPLEEVPPLYDGGGGGALNLNTITVCAGIGGLAPAHTLAYAGHCVTLLESS